MQFYCEIPVFDLTSYNVNFNSKFANPSKVQSKFLLELSCFEVTFINDLGSEDWANRFRVKCRDLHKWEVQVYYGLWQFTLILESGWEAADSDNLSTPTSHKYARIQTLNLDPQWSMWHAWACDTGFWGHGCPSMGWNYTHQVLGVLDQIITQTDNMRYVPASWHYQSTWVINGQLVTDQRHFIHKAETWSPWYIYTGIYL